MKSIITLVCFISFNLAANCQVKQLVQWTFTVKKVSTGIYELSYATAIARGWYEGCAEDPGQRIS